MPTQTSSVRTLLGYESIEVLYSHKVITYIYEQEPANKACIGHLGLSVFGAWF